MPLNILLADDSVPAQNMGKKILVDAGYSVLTVSNGLEALRKIADSIPDIAILDIFMPGYTGLEICERLRAKAATATLPVILTVGKLEPYRPQDGEQVHSNAVIVKPFAAAELISAVRSLIGSPSDAAESHPVSESHVAVDPLQESPQEEPEEAVADEPLFSLDSSAAREDESPSAAREPIIYDDEPFLPNGPESLAFNPDAEHIPFRASAVDLIPEASHSVAEHDASAFTEFDLQPERSHYSPGAQQGISTMVEEPLLAMSAAVAVTGLAISRSTVLVADTPIAEGVASISSQAPELDWSALDTPALDPLPEVREAVGQPEINLEVAAADAEGALAPAAISQEEEARKLAFEALFDSTEPFPVENTPVEFAGSSLDILPSMADLSSDHPFNVVPDSEIESLLDNRQPEFIAPEPDPYLMQEESPASVVGAIPERDPLLDDSETGWSGTASAPQPEETTVQAAGVSYSPEAAEYSELTAPLPLEAVEATPIVEVEAQAAEPETPAPACPAEIAPAVAEAATEPAQFVPKADELSELTAWSPLEAVEAETQDVAVEAHAKEPETLASGYPAEVVPAVAEAAIEQAQLVPEAVPSAEQQGTPEQVVHLETEAAPADALPEQFQPESVEPQPEMHLAQSSSAPEVPSRSSDTERIHQAVDRVFDRFKSLLVAAIVRELARHD